MPPRQLRTIPSTSAAGTAISTRLTRRRARRNGALKPVKIRTSVINRAFNLRLRSPSELFMLVVEMDICMQSMPRRVVNVGTIQRIKGGSIVRRQSVAAWSTPERRMATGSLRLTRKRRLKFTLDAKGAIFSSPALAGEMVYVGVSNGRLLAVDARSGKLLWDYQTEGSKQDPMKMLKPDGSLNNEAIYARYFGDYQDMVLAFYRVFSVGAIWSSPVVDKGVVYFGSTDGLLYAIH